MCWFRQINNFVSPSQRDGESEQRTEAIWLFLIVNFCISINLKWIRFDDSRTHVFVIFIPDEWAHKQAEEKQVRDDRRICNIPFIINQIQNTIVKKK